MFETHVQADHVSGLPALVEAGATAYLPAGATVEFEHVTLGDGEVVELGNTIVRALATPGHAPAHNAYVVADRRRGTEEPWLVFTGDSLLVGDVGRPDLHAGGDAEPAARQLHGSIERLLELPDHVLVYPSHYGGSVCGRGLSSNPFSSIGFERRHNDALQHSDAADFAEALASRPAACSGEPARDRRGQPSRHSPNAGMSATAARLGLRANAGQFFLLVGLNAFVGAMVGLERSMLPLVGERDFDLASKSAILSFVVAFGITKALANLAAGGLADRVGRKRLLVIGWLLALPVPLMIALAPSWGWIVAANLFLGANQGLAWSMTVVMKIDLVGPRRRGLALGLNESAGYLGVADRSLRHRRARRHVRAAHARLDDRRGHRRARDGDLDPLRARHRGARRARAARPRRRRHAHASLGFRARDAPRSDAARLLTGRARQQPERRARLGPRAALPRGERRQRARRSAPSRLSTRPSGARASSSPAGSPTTRDASL